MREMVSQKYRRFSLGLFSVLLTLGLLGSGSVWALPPVNLGLTSFLDGGPPAGPGFYYTHYLQYYRATVLKDANGHDALPPGADFDLDVWVSASQFIYQSNQDLLLGGKWGMNLIVPVVFFDLSHNLGGPPQDNGAGLGDILVGPFLQWDPIMGPNGPIFMHRIELSAYFPTGKYDNDRELNPGSNIFSFNPYWAGTVFITPKWTASWRLHYLWNSENDDPNRLFALSGVGSTQDGQAIHLNFASAYEVWEKRLRIGVNGYYLKQITDTQADGQDVPNSREQVLGIGPGAVFHISQNNHIFMNLYFETAVENRTEGTRLNMRYVHHF